jgi:prenyltransferase beta subunit
MTKKPEVKNLATLNSFNSNCVKKCVIFIFHDFYYILTRGGLIDKPGKSSDYYHTCYTLSGLSVAQHFICHKTHSTLVLGDKRSVRNSRPPFSESIISIICTMDE